MRIGTNELLIILVVALLIFGPKNLPKLGKMFGKTMKNFKEGMDDVDDDGETKKAETKTEGRAWRTEMTPMMLKRRPRRRLPRRKKIRTTRSNCGYER